MEVYSINRKIINNHLDMDIPKNFNGREVKIIIIPIENSVSKQELKENESLADFLLNGHVWSDEDYNNFLDATKEIREWGMR